MILKCSCDDDIHVSIDVMKMMTHDNTEMKQKIIGDAYGVNVTKAVTMHAKTLASAKGKVCNDSHESLQVIIDTSLHNNDHHRIAVLKLFNLRKRRCNDCFNNNERLVKTRADCTKETAKERIDLRVNSEVGTSMGTNTFKFDILNDVKHPHRIWNHMYCHNRHEVLLNSDVHASCRERCPHLTISKTDFKDFF